MDFFVHVILVWSREVGAKINFPAELKRCWIKKYGHSCKNYVSTVNHIVFIHSTFGTLLVSWNNNQKSLYQLDVKNPHPCCLNIAIIAIIVTKTPLDQQKIQKSKIFWRVLGISKLHESFWIWYIIQQPVISKKNWNFNPTQTPYIGGGHNVAPPPPGSWLCWAN